MIHSPLVIEDGNSYGTYLDNLFRHLKRIGVDGWNLGLEKTLVSLRSRRRLRRRRIARHFLQVKHVGAEERERSHQDFRHVLHGILDREVILEQVELGVER